MNLYFYNSIYNSFQKKKNLEINLTKEGNGLYTVNCKAFLKEIKEDINRWKYILYYALKNLILLKCSY